MSGTRYPTRANFDLPFEPAPGGPIHRYPVRANFGLLPEPERSPASFFTSAFVNLAILSVAIYIGMTAKHVIQQHHYEQTELIFPTTPPPEPVKMKVPPPPKVEPPKLPEVKLDAPKINMPKVEPKPDLKPIHMEAKVALPVVKEAKPSIILAPQPKAALTAAAPAQVPQAHPSTTPVHFGETFGVTPNPNATRPATVAAIGNPYGGMQGPAVAPRGVVGSAGIGNGTKSGSNAGTVGKVASVGMPAGTATTSSYGGGKVAAAGIPAVQVSRGPNPHDRRRSQVNQSRGDFEAAGAIYQRSPRPPRPGRRGSACHIHRRRPGTHRGSRSWTGPRPGRRGTASGSADQVPSRHAQRAGDRYDYQYHDHLPIGLGSNSSIHPCGLMRPHEDEVEVEPTSRIKVHIRS